MPKGVLSQLTIWTLILGGCVAIGGTASGAEPAAPQAPAVQPAPAPEPRPAATPARPPGPMALRPLPGVVEQMQALERHARVSMLCYTGRLGDARLASAPKPLDPVAFHITARK